LRFFSSFCACFGLVEKRQEKMGKDDISSGKDKVKSTDKEKKPKSGKKPKGMNSLNMGERTRSYYETTKGTLVQKLLRRWWYVISWPDSNTNIEIPANYELLDGYPGVYVKVRGTMADENPVGHLIDTRNKETCPNFVNFSRKSSRDLIQLLKSELENQLMELYKAEGKGNNLKLEKKIRNELKWAISVNAEKADKEASKYAF